MDENVGGQGKIYRYFNSRVIKDYKLVKDELWTMHGTVIAPQNKADCEVDIQGNIIAPGFIDLQMNGAFGIDFSNDAAQVQAVASLLPQYGVTSFLPTIVSCSKDRYPDLLSHLQPHRGGKHGASILGVHLEGPFFNAAQRGAHNPKFISAFEESYYGDLKGVKIVTLAPEVPGAAEAIQFLRKKNIIVAAGHTLATYEQMEKAIKEGVSVATHLFNAMTPLHHRAPGILGAILNNASMYYSIIADGVHVHPAILNIAWKAHPKGLFLVTDAISALGQTSGIYKLGTAEVELQKSGAFVRGTQTLAGGVFSMDEMVRHFRSSTGCSLVEAIEVASLRPAKVLGIEKTKGNLHVGADADFIILDDQLNIQACYIANQHAWSVDPDRYNRNGMNYKNPN